MKKLAVIQHHPLEDEGYIRLWADQHQIQLVFWRTWLTSQFVDASKFDGVIVLGGEKNVKDAYHDQNLSMELKWLSFALAQKLPCFGICLGAQMLVHLIGGVVSPAKSGEYGKQPLAISLQSSLRNQNSNATVSTSNSIREAQNIKVLQAHDYQFSFAEKYNHASSSKCSQQLIISPSENVTAIQCHLEWSNKTFALLFPEIVNDARSNQTSIELTEPEVTQCQALLFELLNQRFLSDKTQESL